MSHKTDEEEVWSDDASSVEIEKKPTKKEKVDKRKTGGLANRSPKQIASYERMKEAARIRHETLKQQKIEEGKKLLAKEAQEKEEGKKPEKPKKKSVSKTRVVFDSDSSSSEDETPTIIIKKKKSKSKQNPKKRVVSDDDYESSDHEEEEEAPQPQRHVDQGNYFRYV